MFGFGAEHDDITNDHLGKEGEQGVLPCLCPVLILLQFRIMCAKRYAKMAERQFNSRAI